MHITTPLHHTLFHFIILMTLGGENKLWSSPLQNCLETPVTSSFLGPNILPSTLLSNPQFVFFPYGSKSSFITTQNDKILEISACQSAAQWTTQTTACRPKYNSKRMVFITNCKYWQK
jgi:hypothetical protein